MASTVYQRLSDMETHFIQAATEGSCALDVFGAAWAALSKDIEIAVQTNSLDIETKALANTIASRIDLLNKFLLDFHTHADAMQSELEVTFARIDINGTTDKEDKSREQSPFHSTTPIGAHRNIGPPTRSFNTPYIASAYRWLLTNLHNPYPSKTTRDMIASDTASDRRVIDAWFIDARKRIGWNTLRREAFSNKRVDIVDAAMHFFGGRDPQRPLDENVVFKFLEIEARARDLYAEKFLESTLVTKLDIAAKDIALERKAQAVTDNCYRRKQGRVGQGPVLKRGGIAASSYPSSCRSPGGTPEPILSDQVDISITPTSIFGRKRNMSPEMDFELSFDRPNKRSRLDIPAEINFGATSLPSPAPSFSESLSLTGDDRNSSVTLARVIPVSHKRRLSDASSQAAHRRPRNILSGPRLQSVSDPLPSPATLSAWFEGHFGIPEAVADGDSDLSFPFDVELYKYPDTLQAKQLAGATEPSTYEKGMILSPSCEASSPIPCIPADPLNITTNDFDCSDVFSEYEDETFVAQDDVNHIGRSWLPTFDSSFNYVKASLDTTATTPDTAVIVDSSIPISQNPQSGVDWAFPLFLSHTLPDPLQDIGFSHDFRGVTFGSDPSQLTFYSADFFDNTDTTSRMSTETTKAAKKAKLLEMKEATRRLEAEIAAS